MWIIKAALRYPLTFFVMAILMVLTGLFSIVRTPVDILPDIKLPVISVVWTYAGLPPADMSNRINASALNNRRVKTIVDSVLPVPVGPSFKKLPRGRPGFRKFNCPRRNTDKMRGST